MRPLDHRRRRAAVQENRDKLSYTTTRFRCGLSGGAMNELEQQRRPTAAYIVIAVFALTVAALFTLLLATGI
jgi:hypothetical protein